MNEIAIKNKKTAIKPMLKNAVLVALAGAMLAVFLEPKLSIVCGPLMALAFVYLFLWESYEFVVAVILMANGALGTVVSGSLSFEYILLVLLVFRLFIKPVTISTNRLIFFGIAMAFSLQLYSVEFIDFRELLFSFIYIFSFASMRLDTDSEAFRRFFSGVAFTVVLLAVHAMLTGGVKFYELDNSTSSEVLRTGILGVGVGDSNFSAFVLNIGFLALCFFTGWNPILKALFSVPILYALILTRSFSGFLGFLLLLLLVVLLQKNHLKAFGTLVLAVAVVLLLYQFYEMLSPEFHIEVVDLYMERVTEKTEDFMRGDMASATTNRSVIFSRYMSYIFEEQDMSATLLGGNSLIISSITSSIPHNTYVGILLQFGVVGFVLFVAYALKKLWNAIKRKENPDRRAILILKTFCLFFAITLSFYSDSTYALWMMIILLL